MAKSTRHVKGEEMVGSGGDIRELMPLSTRGGIRKLMAFPTRGDIRELMSLSICGICFGFGLL